LKTARGPSAFALAGAQRQGLPARSGFKGPTRPYEGKFGLFATHLHGDAKLAAFTDGLGSEWRFGETALKPYPVCHFIHGCADAAIDLHHEIAGAAIASVRAFLPEPALHIIAEPAQAKERPGNDYEAKFSAQFVTSYCLLYGRFNLTDLEPAALADTAALVLARRVQCLADPDSAFPTYFSGGVEVTLADGRVLSRHVRVNSGAGERALSVDAVTAKFMASASLAIPAAQAERIKDAVFSLEEVPVTELMALLRGE